MRLFIIMTLLVSTVVANDFTFNKEKGVSIPNFVGELKVFRGKVYKLSQGKREAVQVGTRFFKDDSIVTNEKSFAKLNIVDDTILSLGPNSELNFSHYKFLDKSNREIIYSFIKGQLTAHVKNKAKDGDISIKTKMAVMGIRGTQVLVNHQTIESKEISEFALLTGKAVVTDNKNQFQELNVADRTIYVMDSIKNQSGMEKTQLTKEEFEHLKAEAIKEETDFRPFMPYFEPQKLAQNSPLFPIFHQKIEDQAKPESDSGAVTPQPEGEIPWKNNLQKLNDRLKKNQ